jgi:hypothetical protein
MDAHMAYGREAIHRLTEMGARDPAKRHQSSSPEQSLRYAESRKLKPPSLPKKYSAPGSFFSCSLFLSTFPLQLSAEFFFRQTNPLETRLEHK